MAKEKIKNYTYAAGRRREASARVRLFKGGEESTVNGIVIGKYFSNPNSKAVWGKPFELTNTAGKYYITAKVAGGGVHGQLEALVHGISRALAELDKEKNRAVLKKAGFLTRDSRTRQRRMVGTGGKARRAKQSPKR